MDFYNEMEREFERVHTNIDYLVNNNANLISYINEEFIFTGDINREEEVELKQLLKKYST